jgi:glycosyltransferase involved in cell wall biosynthesis
VGGGAEKSMTTISDSLTQMGFTSLLIGVNREIASASVATNSRRISLRRKWRSGPITWFIALLQLRLNVRQNGINIAVLNGELAESLGIFLSRKIKLVVVEHSGSAWNRYPSLGTLVRTQLRRRGATWVAVSSNLKIAGVPDSKIKRIPNPISVDSTSNATHPRSSNRQGNPRLIFIGRLAPEKDPLLFLEIARASKMKSLVIGNGPMYEQAMKFDCPEAEFLGFVENPWIFIREEDLILFTSIFEGDGMAIAETLIRGCPLLIRRFEGHERFHLPITNTFTTADEAVVLIERHQRDFGALKVSRELKDSEIRNRDPKRVAKLWRELLLQQ